MYVCDNCGQRYDHEDQLKHVFPDIPDLAQRLEPGGVVPAGECPACGALAYPERPQVRVAILLEGGLVRDVLSDLPGVGAAVFDLDTEGADEEETAALDRGGGPLLGTPVAKEASADPAFVRALFAEIERREA